MRLEVEQHVGDIGRRANGDDRLSFRNAVRRSEHGGTTQRVANEDFRGPEVPAQVVGGGDQVLDIRGKIGVLELPLGRPEAREIESQDRDAQRGQLRSYVSSCGDVFRAREAMRKQRMSTNARERQIQTRCQVIAKMTGEGHAD
jgi:hypothetical protein